MAQKRRIPETKNVVKSRHTILLLRSPGGEIGRRKGLKIPYIWDISCVYAPYRVVKKYKMTHQCLTWKVSCYSLWFVIQSLYDL